jgi:hypothetical protein
VYEQGYFSEYWKHVIDTNFHELKEGIPVLSGRSLTSLSNKELTKCYTKIFTQARKEVGRTNQKKALKMNLAEFFKYIH